MAARLLADCRAGSTIAALCRRYRVSYLRIAEAVPAAERAKRPLTDAERSLIRHLYGEGLAMQAIAARLHRAPCTVSEVLPRGGSTAGPPPLCPGCRQGRHSGAARPGRPSLRGRDVGPADHQRNAGRHVGGLAEGGPS